MRSRLRRLFDTLFAWYDPEREEASRAHTERTLERAELVATEPRSIDVVRESYRAYARHPGVRR